MIIPIESVFSKTETAEIRNHLLNAQWQDGKTTAGNQAADIKNNQQLAVDSALAQQLGDYILNALAQHPLFISAALPLKILPPMFNRYDVGETYGFHVDNAIRIAPGTHTRIRTDLSATIFFSEEDEYEGGELEIEDSYGTHQVKLSAGDMILYPSTSRHRVTPVTKGCRLAAFFWIQSMVREHEQREILFDLDQSVQSLTVQHHHQHPDVIRLTAVYHRLIRQLADT